MKTLRVAVAAGCLFSLLVGCGVESDAGHETIIESASVESAGQQDGTVDVLAGCCNAKCSNGSRIIIAGGPTPEECTAYMTNRCATRGGLNEAWWGACTASGLTH